MAGGVGDVTGPVTLLPVTGIPQAEPGDDIVELILIGLGHGAVRLEDGDVLAVTHKLVSKVEGAVVAVDEDDPASYREVVEAEAIRVLRRRGDLVIAETRHGLVCANAGVDRSNVAAGSVVTLPVDPDSSAHRIRVRLERASGVRLGVVITDTFGRAWRRGLVDVAIGISGLASILDLRGATDSYGRTLEVTEIAIADEVAAAADLVMGKATGVPCAVVRGLSVVPGTGRAADLIRDVEEDLFR
jgi:coenzyme F420-0:L-glutamate ligase/coenzyme F420-1:gamma-L-glutamate ligase